MKYLKFFEKYISKFKVGDHVIANSNEYYKPIVDFLNNNVGIISGIHTKNTFELYYFDVKYDNIPEDIIQFTKNIDGKTFVVYEKELRLATEEEIQIQKIKKSTNKYNL